jgi:hypothetical protein
LHRRNSYHIHESIHHLFIAIGIQAIINKIQVCLYENIQNYTSYWAPYIAVFVYFWVWIHTYIVRYDPNYIVLDHRVSTRLVDKDLDFRSLTSAWFIGLRVIAKYEIGVYYKGIFYCVDHKDLHDVAAFIYSSKKACLRIALTKL